MFVTWFPNLLHLKIFCCVVDVDSVVSFPHLKHLELVIPSGNNNSVKLLQAKTLDSFKKKNFILQTIKFDQWKLFHFEIGGTDISIRCDIGRLKSVYGWTFIDSWAAFNFVSIYSRWCNQFHSKIKLTESVSICSQGPFWMRSLTASIGQRMGTQRRRRFSNHIMSSWKKCKMISNIWDDE